MFGKRGSQNSNKMLIECGSLYILTIQVEIQNDGDYTGIDTNSTIIRTKYIKLKEQFPHII